MDTFASPIDDFYAELSHLIDAGFFNVAAPLGVVYRFLIVLSVLWMAIRWFTGESAVLYPALRRVAAVSVILWLALNWPWYTEAFVGSMSRIGVQVGTGDGFTGRSLVDVNRPSSFGEHAFTTAFQIYDYAMSLESDDWVPSVAFFVKGLMLLITSLVVFCCGAAVVILILTYMVLFKVGTVVVFVLLPFLLGEQTKWMCERALGWLVSCGVRFMVLSMVIGFLYAVAQRTVGDLGGRVTTVAGLFQVLLFNLLLLVFVALANRFAGEIAGGAASLSLAGVAAPVASAGHHATSAARHAAVAGALLGGGAVAAYAYLHRKGEDASDPTETPTVGPTASPTTTAGSPAAAVTSAALLARSSAASRMRPAAPAPHAPEVIDAEWTYATPLPPTAGPRGLLA